MRLLCPFEFEAVGPMLTLRWLASLIFCAAMLAFVPPAALADEAHAAKTENEYRTEIVPLIKKFCIECHATGNAEAEVALDRYKTTQMIVNDQKTWQHIVTMIKSGAMPPEDSPQPSSAERTRLVQWLEQTMYYVDCTGAPDPGRVTIRRLNRAEYNNTIRDMLGVTFKPADDFPSDDVGSGFDNIGDVLSLPPLLMEKYLAAAEQIATSVIVDDPMKLVGTITLQGNKLEGRGAAKLDTRTNRWGMPSAGGVGAKFTIEQPGNYVVRIVATATEAGNEPAKLLVRVDKRSEEISVRSRGGRRTPMEIRTRLAAGEHFVSAEFINDFYDPDAKDPTKRDRNVTLETIEVAGPLEIKPDQYPVAHRKLITATPSSTTTVLDAAQTSLRPFVNRAFRRRVNEDEIRKYAQLVDASVRDGDNYEQGMQVAVIAVLCSPHFLFRIEQDPNPNDPKNAHLVGDYELATRLSYFLWSSLPDNELFLLATSGKLREEQTLREQVKRMLADDRSQALADNFASQWLNLRLLDSASPDPGEFKDFSPELKSDMQRETLAFFMSVVKEDRSVLDFIDGKFSFLNERLAKHYGIKDVSGDEFQLVSLSGTNRGGVLTHASILTLTSNPERTSPVKRGKWILDNMLGAPPPEPPADVPQLDATQKAQPGLSLRKQLEIHRENAVCASCHRTMDALGFGLENFDAIGKFREKEKGQAIDSSGTLPEGESFQGPVELAKVLRGKPNEFTRCMTEKMLTYALGRGLVHYDRCSVDKITKQVAGQEYRFSALVTEIVLSDPFRKRRGDGGQP
ncbi:Protein of unknown function DUF1592 [Pirellula staleyi DSM 6068]|uniref:Cytochrome c domain-containing protein n=1 Tax=Pirellula staleyi (strain ATCC 27377 / DSM 6068 / ICPB 4128) TaxID=530564 RepID=D2R7R9_PIRSD|nr:DUF1592 domain-containing protein [Pirellula staleyi]ADB17495.1 Protein of unknown function DUF1592 [Pirellula staleyi DSM 6068]